MSLGVGDCLAWPSFFNHGVCSAFGHLQWMARCVARKDFWFCTGLVGLEMDVELDVFSYDDFCCDLRSAFLVEKKPMNCQFSN